MACHLLEVIHRNIAIPDVVSYNALISSAEKGLAELEKGTGACREECIKSHHADPEGVISRCIKSLSERMFLAPTFQLQLLVLSHPASWRPRSQPKRG